MKKHITFIGFILIFALVACDKEIDLVIPELFVTPTDAGVLDTVTAVAYAAVTIEGEPVQIDSYLWSILDPDGNEVNLLAGNRDSVKWVPLKEGDYLINVTITAGNKSVAKTSLSTFKNTIRTFQTALIGEWEGSAIADFAAYGTRRVSFTIEANGLYSANVISVYGGDRIPPYTVLDNGVDECNDPGKKIIVNNILNTGQATGTMKFCSWNDGLFQYPFSKMAFSNDYDELTFKSGTFSGEPNITFKLTRQN